MVEIEHADGIARTSVRVVMTKTERLMKMAVVRMGSFCCHWSLAYVSLVPGRGIPSWSGNPDHA